MNTEIKVPDGVSGRWKVETIEVSKQQAFLSTIREPHRQVREGKYKRLAYKGPDDPRDITVMSNTPAEIRDHTPYYWALGKREGHVLINGLGLGFSIQLALDEPSVKKITVIELNEDVIKLVAPTYKHKKVEIIQHDAYTYQPPKGIRYAIVWHDIWNEIDSDNLPFMAKLHRKYGRRCDWQGSWSKEECLRKRRREKRDEEYVNYAIGGDINRELGGTDEGSRSESKQKKA